MSFFFKDTPDCIEFDGTAEAAEQRKEKIFLKLATFVLGRYTIAHSTAAVQRTFSIVSCVKTKVRRLWRLCGGQYFNCFFLFHPNSDVSVPWLA
jgi:hypothetical protein